MDLPPIVKRHFKDGDVVVYQTKPHPAAVLWGNNTDPEGLLDLNGVYVVEKADVRSSYTKLRLRGVQGNFNSVSFSLL